MATRPNGTKNKWAENADAADIEEPTAERDDGYKADQTRPSDEFNWLVRELFDWVQYFDEKFQGSTGLIDFFDQTDGIQYSDNGNVSVTNPSDTADLWEADFSHSSGGSSRSKLAFDLLEAIEQLQGPSLKGTVGGDNLVSVNQLAETDSGFSITDATGGFILDILRQNADAGIDVQGTGGANNEGGFNLGFLRPSQTDSENFERLPVKDPNDTFSDLTAEAMVDSLNTAKATALIDGLGGTPNVRRAAGFVSGTAGISGTGGNYDLELSLPINAGTPANVLHGDVQIIEPSGSPDNTIYDTRIQPVDNDTINVRIIDSNGETAPSSGKISVTVYYE